MTASKSKRLSEGDTQHRHMSTPAFSLHACPLPRGPGSRRGGQQHGDQSAAPPTGWHIRASPHALSLNPHNHHDTGICLPLALNEEIGSGKTGNLSRVTSARGACILKPRMSERSWAPPAPALRHSWGLRGQAQPALPVVAPPPGGPGQGTGHRQLGTNFYFLCWSGQSMAMGQW